MATTRDPSHPLEWDPLSGSPRPEGQAPPLDSRARGPAGSASPDSPSPLAGIREALEALDGELVGLLARRAGMARLAGIAKRRAGAPVVDPVQEAAVVRRAAQLARSEGLPEEEVRAIFWRLIALSRQVQGEVAP